MRRSLTLFCVVSAVGSLSVAAQPAESALEDPPVRGPTAGRSSNVVDQSEADWTPRFDPERPKINPEDRNACRDDLDCVLSPYHTRVSKVEDCYCPEESRPRLRWDVEIFHWIWNRRCGGEWFSNAGCQRPIDARFVPRKTRCVDGTCRAFIRYQRDRDRLRREREERAARRAAEAEGADGSVEEPAEATPEGAPAASDSPDPVEPPPPDAS